MGRTAHVSKVKIHKEAGKNKVKRIQFEGFPGVARMGVHGGIAEFFKVEVDEPLPSTLDYVVGAVGGCLTGTLAGALEARGIRADPEKLEAVAEGRIEEIDGKLLLTHVTVKYRLKVPKEQRASAERALEHHESRCPVSESVKRGITVDWQSEIEEES
jgi:uncharacterized OsmC-like protein